MDASLIAAPKQRNTSEEKQRIKAGETAGEIWSDQPTKARQKGEPECAIGSSTMASDARWTVQFGKARPVTNGKQPPDIAIPTFG